MQCCIKRSVLAAWPACLGTFKIHTNSEDYWQNKDNYKNKIMNNFYVYSLLLCVSLSNMVEILTRP